LSGVVENIQYLFFPLNRLQQSNIKIIYHVTYFANIFYLDEIYFLKYNRLFFHDFRFIILIQLKFITLIINSSENQFVFILFIKLLINIHDKL
jgi:hypothetical protein